jgi:hypothetical protein
MKAYCAVATFVMMWKVGQGALSSSEDLEFSKPPGGGSPKIVEPTRRLPGEVADDAIANTAKEQAQTAVTSVKPGKTATHSAKSTVNNKEKADHTTKTINDKSKSTNDTTTSMNNNPPSTSVSCLDFEWGDQAAALQNMMEHYYRAHAHESDLQLLTNSNTVDLDVAKVEKQVIMNWLEVMNNAEEMQHGTECEDKTKVDKILQNVDYNSLDKETDVKKIATAKARNTFPFANIRSIVSAGECEKLKKDAGGDKNQVTQLLDKLEELTTDKKVLEQVIEPTVNDTRLAKEIDAEAVFAKYDITSPKKHTDQAKKDAEQKMKTILENTDPKISLGEFEADEENMGETPTEDDDKDKKLRQKAVETLATVNASIAACVFFLCSSSSYPFSQIFKKGETHLRMQNRYP